MTSLHKSSLVIFSLYMFSEQNDFLQITSSVFFLEELSQAKKSIRRSQKLNYLDSESNLCSGDFKIG